MPRYAALLDRPDDPDAWRKAAKTALALGLEPDEIEWRVAGAAQARLDAAPPLPTGPPSDLETPALRVPRAFVAALEEGIQHRDPERFDLLYALLRRIAAGERRVMEAASDPQVHRLHALRKAVRRDAHKMKAFVRFRGASGDALGGVSETEDDVARAVAEAEGAQADGVEAEGAGTDAARDDYIAWFEPEHHIVRATAPFFARRFTAMRWAILTPDLSARWDGAALTFGPGRTRADAPPDDAMEEAWRAYYTAIFNPARLKVGAMKSEMPVKYWRNLPEARLIRPLIREAGRRTEEMIEAGRAAGLVGFETYRPSASEPKRGAGPAAPIGATHAASHAASTAFESEPGESGGVPSSITEARAMDANQNDLFSSDDAPDAAASAPSAEDRPDLRALEKAAAACTLCPLYAPATQTVFGEGPADAPLMFIGEQPGDKEDQAGRPFVGPAGRVFDRALEDAGIDRGKVYVTNSVKHFKFVARGPRRIHQKPGVSEIKACNVWLQEEIKAVRPAMLVGLGATAGRAIFGREIGVMKSRGTIFDLDEAMRAYITVHPSFLLRLPDEEQKRMEYNRFLADLRRIADAVPEARVAA